MRDRLNSLRTAYVNYVKDLEVIKTNNARASYLQEQMKSVDDYLDIAPTYVSALNSILMTTKDEYSKYQSNRVAFIENSLAEILALLFPNEFFIPKLNYSLERRNIRCELIFTDADGNERHPRITEGDFMKDLIAFTSAIKVLELVGSKTFYIDEAFSHASLSNKEKMGNVIGSYIDEGLQMILISQSAECYQNLPRKEFYLVKEDNVCKLVEERLINMED
ncbi:MAG: hypothetical protein ACLR3R_20090 [Clostridium paraputrificum]